MSINRKTGKTTQNEVNNINKEAKKISTKLRVEIRIETLAGRSPNPPSSQWEHQTTIYCNTKDKYLKINFLEIKKALQNQQSLPTTIPCKSFYISLEYYYYVIIL